MSRTENIEITVSINGETYEAELDTDDSVTIHWRHDGICEQCGRGTWTGSRIDDCTADLGEDVYGALDDALMDAEFAARSL